MLKIFFFRVIPNIVWLHTFDENGVFRTFRGPEGSTRTFSGAGVFYIFLLYVIIVCGHMFLGRPVLIMIIRKLIF